MLENRKIIKNWGDMMKKTLFIIVSTILLVGLSSNIYAIPYSFDYAGYNWGVMDIEIDYAADIMEVTYTASTGLPGDSQATGFGFDFNPDLSPVVFNNGTAPFVDPDPYLNWIQLANLNVLPNPANSSTISKNDFTFGVTEGNANNINPPGILPGNSDTFYLDFSSIYDLQISENIINLASVRLQSLPDDINGGSLHLVATSVPEPGTILLFGTGIAGLAGVVMRRKKK